LSHFPDAGEWSMRGRRTGDPLIQKQKHGEHRHD
jgi:hypothetical protein